MCNIKFKFLLYYGLDSMLMGEFKMALLTDFDNFKSSRELLIQVDVNGVIKLVSSNCFDILEIKQNELISTNIYALLGYKFDDLLSKRNVESVILKKDGEKLFFDIVANPMFNENFEIYGIDLSLINVNKYVQREKRNDEFTKIFENSKDLIYKFQIIPEFKFIYISPSVKDILGYNVEEYYSNPLFPFQLIHPEDTEIQQSKIDKKSDFSKTFSVRFKHKEGYYVWIEDYILPTFGEKDELLSVAGISRNITKRKHLEEKLQEQKKALEMDFIAEIQANQIMEKTLKAQEELLVNISHELKTPLNVIFSTAQLLDMYYKSGSLENKRDAFINYISSIKQNSYRLSKLINNIVDTSKIEAGFFELNLSNNNIVEVVEEITMSVTSFTEIKQISIIFDTDVEEKIIACDPEKIERVMLNLISNAIKFSNKGEEILVNIRDLNEWVEISVKDNGVGIDNEHLNMIFDRFKQVDKSLSRNAEGTGIGLSLVKSIVELHGGSISVESKYGNGSKFIVILPAREVDTQDALCNRNMKNRSERVQVEFSDVYL